MEQTLDLGAGSGLGHAKVDEDMSGDALALDQQAE